MRGAMVRLVAMPLTSASFEANQNGLMLIDSHLLVISERVDGLWRIQDLSVSIERTWQITTTTTATAPVLAVLGREPKS